MTETQIMISNVYSVAKSLETPSNVILPLPFWHSTLLGHVIYGLDLCSQIPHRLQNQCFGVTYFLAMI
jgi:hypothetical protein